MRPALAKQLQSPNGGKAKLFVKPSHSSDAVHSRVVGSSQEFLVRCAMSGRSPSPTPGGPTPPPAVAKEAVAALFTTLDEDRDVRGC